MQTHLDSLLTKKYLLTALLASASANLISNLFGKDLAILVGNFSYVPIAGSLLVLSLLMIKRYGMSGQHAIAWVSFGGYAISSFIGEMLWVVQELYLKIDPFPSTPDIFYLVSYPFLLMFFIAYFQPVRNAITKKMLAGPVMFSAGILATSLYFTIETGSDQPLFEVAMAAIYPVFDAIVIIPALVGVSLFFKGKVNLMWTLFCFGIILLFVADTAFLLAQNEDTYYTGNPMEILFSWNYILLSFGVYNHLTMFRKQKANKFEDLR
ncbi:MAG: hypothetical protein WAO91_05405 [Candidatus Nitrosotenuis sp.]